MAIPSNISKFQKMQCWLSFHFPILSSGENYLHFDTYGMKDTPRKNGCRKCDGYITGLRFRSEFPVTQLIRVSSYFFFTILKSGLFINSLKYESKSVRKWNSYKHFNLYRDENWNNLYFILRFYDHLLVYNKTPIASKYQISLPIWVKQKM